MSLVFVTGNKGKLEEVSAMLGRELESVNLPLEEIQDVDVSKVAIHKAKQAFEILKKPLFVDDTGLIIESWNGFPGPFLAHILKCGGMPLLLNMLKGAKSRNAILITTIAFHDGSIIHTFEGRLKGQITENIMGDRGFGIDGIFMPYGHSKVYGEMSLTEKNSISQRALAVEELKKYLQKT